MAFYKNFWVGIFISAMIFISCRSPEGAKIPITTSSPEALKLYRKGIDSYDNLRVTEAHEYFKQALAKDPDFAMAHLHYGSTSGDVKIYLSELDKAMERMETISEGERLLLLGAQASVSGLATQQQEYYVKLVEIYPQDERAHYLLGNFYFFQQEYNLAIGAYRRATEINPKFAPAYNMLGYSHRQLENFDEAEEAFKKYIQLIPRHPNPYDSYAELLMKKGEFKKSIDIYRQALKIEPQFTPSVIGIATNLNFLDRHSEALATLQSFLLNTRTTSEKREILYGMMVSYLDHGDFPLALEINDSLISIARQNSDIGGLLRDYETRGIILLEYGRMDEAQHSFQAMQEIIRQADLSPEFKANAQLEVMYYLVRIHISRNELSEARIKAEEFGRQAELKKNRTQMWRYHALLGLIALQARQYDEALGEFRRSDLQDPNILYYTAVAYQAKGDVSQAHKFYEKVINYHALNSVTYSFVRHKARAMLAEMGAV